ncbi:hypothetical protein RRG08_060211 [Elysia crispata]|uniref:Uncharacterized protein n=1 Tax=Elysia crispata TaxID=231223 RepID=A0AAE0YLK8_9GAST|nr:hypothetical protein RRG08_060211 [Elysia crispata]
MEDYGPSNAQPQPQGSDGFPSRATPSKKSLGAKGDQPYDGRPHKLLKQLTTGDVEDGPRSAFVTWCDSEIAGDMVNLEHGWPEDFLRSQMSPVSGVQGMATEQSWCPFNLVHHLISSQWTWVRQCYFLWTKHPDNSEVAQMSDCVHSTLMANLQCRHGSSDETGLMETIPEGKLSCIGL